MEAEAFIALGGNVGDVQSTFDQALVLLCDGRAVRLKARSSDYRTPPWGVIDQPPYVNAVIAVMTSLNPHGLLDRAKECERALGRDGSREQRWGPRTIDPPSPVRARIRIGAVGRNRTGPQNRRGGCSRCARSRRQNRH
jgi:2-amino-4-hydroxy-6-hydroxymethyldihydropteridine diphosphokinase